MLVLLGEFVLLDVLDELVYSLAEHVELLIVALVPVDDLIVDLLYLLVHTLQLHKLLLLYV